PLSRPRRRRHGQPPRRRPASCRPAVEPLEDRCLLSYSVFDLGGVTARAINNAGQVAGSMNNHAALLSQDGVVDLGTLGGTSSAACAINNLGQVVGTAQDSSGGYQAFFWDSTRGMQNLGVAGTYTAAYGVNDAGRVAGTLGSDYDYYPHAFLWDSAGGLRD